ncbi:MAG: permease [Candidatus Marinimicrobia bacterium]|nr:permease [Candidatus Neomarinimicrobiota bacterium]
MNKTEKRKGNNSMLTSIIIMALLSTILFLIAYFQGKGNHIVGLKIAFRMTLDVLPLLIFAFILAGMIRSLIPNEIISKWIGQEAGFRGLLIGTIVGGITPGGPYVALPVIAGLIQSGASIGTMVAFVTAWSLWAIGRMPMEIAIVGWKFYLTRLLSTFFFPPIAGFIADRLYKIL